MLLSDYLLAAVLIAVGGKFALDLRPDAVTSCGGALKGQYARNAVQQPAMPVIVFLNNQLR
jgi:hypothetical protein